MRVAVDAYFNNNLGDDLFLNILIDRYPNVHFDFLLTKKEACKAFQNHPRVNYVSRKDVFKNILKYKAYIFIGGSMFQEPLNWKAQWKLFNLTVNIFNFFRKRTFVLGCNFGPFETTTYKERYSQTFRKLTHMTVRDDLSYELLKNQGINLSKHPDIVFSMCKQVNHEKNSQDIVGISVIDWHKNKNLEGYINLNKKIIIDSIQKGRKVRLFAFQNTNGVSDLNLCNTILEQLKKYQKDIEVISYNGNIIRFLDKYLECGYVVTSRFHSLILSLLYSQDICPIIYSEKTSNTLKYLGLNLQCISMDETVDFNETKVADVFNANSKINLQVIKDISKRAHKHFEFVDKCLNNEN
ncbi:polysaccharide pyruvyl transferase family protein [Priestia flexa]|uniref:polysaccharide pyruvyl transferase family protein n=1 Tax=Priestia flexa TaxID=86664 RepID=UPI00248F99A2|nr:polysaccharide pyruvyl transferase family protein [Priestia flexa]